MLCFLHFLRTQRLRPQCVLRRRPLKHVETREDQRTDGGRLDGSQEAVLLILHRAGVYKIKVRHTIYTAWCWWFMNLVLISFCLLLVLFVGIVVVLWKV
jgi:hypothetical protein